MSFTKVNPGTWATNAQLTSPQMNTLDTDHANSLDKTTAGDTIAGTVNFSGTGNVTANIAGTVKATIAAGIKSTVAGGIQLAGGSTDQITFSATRTRTIICNCWDISEVGSAAITSAALITSLVPLTSSNIAYSSFGFGVASILTNTGSSASFPYFMPIRQVHTKATLSSVTFTYTPVGGHSGLPVYQPWIRVFRVDPVATARAELSSTGAAQSAVGTLVGYNGITQQLTLTCDQNNVIDTTQYTYFAILGDEGGTNALAGLKFQSLTCNYTAIGDMSFP